MFIAQGFEETTVEQIASEVGMSARSVFRYFDTKEDMVVGSMQELGARLAAALADRPADEDAWQALRGALGVLLAGIGTWLAVLSMTLLPRLRAVLDAGGDLA